MASITAAPGSVDQLDNGANSPAWVNASNIFTQNYVYAEANIDNSLYPSDYLRAYNFDFSAIPNDATITGVVANVWAIVSNDSFITPVFQLLSTTRGPVGTAYNITSFSGTNSLQTVGGTTNLWGNPLTPAWVKDPDFGISVFADSEEDSEYMYLDSVTLTVYYTTGPVLPKIYIGGSSKNVTNAWVYVGDSRKDVTGIWICVNGTYKPLV